MNGNYQNGKATRVIEFWDGIWFITRRRSIEKVTSYVGLV